MPGKDHLINMKGIQELPQVFRQGIRVITGFRVVRLAVPAAGDGHHMELIRKAGRKPFKDMRRASPAGDEQQHRAVTAPIQVVQAGTICIHKTTCMRGHIHFFSLNRVDREMKLT